jgi:hypothetical protein
MKESSRRGFLQSSAVVGIIGLTGCSQITGGSDIQDTDGDGVIDSEDYAPRDASVQDASDIEEKDSTEQDENGPDQSTESNPNTDQPDPDTGTVVIDDFEDGSLSSEWRDVFDTSNVGTDAGRSVFTVQSSTIFDGQSILKGDRTPYGEGGSTITRDDFIIQSDGATIRLDAKFGETYSTQGRPNGVALLSSDSGKDSVIKVTQRLDRAANNLGFVSDESLRGPTVVELRDINFQDQQVGEVAIDSQVIDTNVPFHVDVDIDKIDMIRVHQGHWRQEHNIAINRIEYSV